MSVLMSVLRSHNNKTRGGLGRVCATGMYRSIEHVNFPKFQTGIFVEWKAPKLRGFLQPRVEKKVDMNCTLFDCGIKKSIETRKGEKFDITNVFPKSVNLPKRQVECEICNESFAAKKYLDSHVQFHRDLREDVKSRRRRLHSTQEVKYGRWTPKNRYNIDQVPLPFVVDQEKTYDVTGNKQVWVSQPSSGLDKRQATLQLCIGAEGDQHVKPAIVFRGKGNVSSAEKTQYDQDVDVFFQTSAWMDSQLNQEWVKRTLIPGIGTSP